MGKRRHLLRILFAVAVSAASATVADAREAPTTGDRWSPIDPTQLVSRVVVAPDAPLPSGVFRVATYDIQTLPWNRLPSNGLGLMRLQPPVNSDADGIPWKVVNGRNYYSPGNIAADGLRFVDSYVQTGNPAYLDRARVRAGKLRAIGMVRDGALFVAYRFDYPNRSEEHTSELQSPC